MTFLLGYTVEVTFIFIRTIAETPGVLKRQSTRCLITEYLTHKSVHFALVYDLYGWLSNFVENGKW